MRQPNPIIGNSPPMREIRKLIDTIADSTATVLISGESGTAPVPGDESSALATGTASSCRQSTPTSELKVVLQPGQNLGQQSLPVDPSGVVYQSVTRQPVGSAVVTLSPAGSCAGG